MSRNIWPFACLPGNEAGDGPQLFYLALVAASSLAGARTFQMHGLLMSKVRDEPGRQVLHAEIYARLGGE